MKPDASSLGPTSSRQPVLRSGGGSGPGSGFWPRWPESRNRRINSRKGPQGTWSNLPWQKLGVARMAQHLVQLILKTSRTPPLPGETIPTARWWFTTRSGRAGSSVTLPQHRRRNTGSAPRHPAPELLLDARSPPSPPGISPGVPAGAGPCPRVHPRCGKGRIRNRIRRKPGARIYRQTDISLGDGGRKVPPRAVRTRPDVTRGEAG